MTPGVIYSDCKHYTSRAGMLDSIFDISFELTADENNSLLAISIMLWSLI